MVGLVFGEADGAVLDAVRRAEFFEEQDEFTQFFILGYPYIIVNESSSREDDETCSTITYSNLIID